ncbi:tRNA modification GTPase [Natronocella acetinitrilica]|uniref:tRNA modification GTPase MnmE n=1 Tax=Natronocella acetinitrilica TaxID=414046 RepID=A0AAE3G0U0_9GAMM|nr:tRNA modification GTPase [Natronocella acetinitrilica]
MQPETICAIATPPGRGGVGIVRVSGPDSSTLAARLCTSLPAPRHAGYRRFTDSTGEIIDEGLVLYFPAPGSFTGEDVVELQGHGGPIPMQRLLQRLVELGARLARPGEFSERAFLNGRLDLAQAEAVADLIAASSEAGANAAMASLQGGFSREVHGLTDALVRLRVHVESAIDFPDEEIDFLSDGAVAAQLAAVCDQLARVRKAAAGGRLLRDGMTVVIAGRPNAGKSSLLNALAGYEAAIVTDVAGTTRDVLREHLHIDGMPLHVVDTAGLRDSADRVEQEGIRRARDALQTADRILLVVDDCPGEGEGDGDGAGEQAIRAQLPPGTPVTEIRTKTDLSGGVAGERPDAGHSVIGVSAVTGAGLEALRGHLAASMGYTGGEGVFSARARHLDALDRAAEALEAAAGQLEIGAGELVAEELRRAQQALAEITGEFTTEDLLGEIFSSFCIGK